MGRRGKGPLARYGALLELLRRGPPRTLEAGAFNGLERIRGLPFQESFGNVGEMRARYRRGRCRPVPHRTCKALEAIEKTPRSSCAWNVGVSYAPGGGGRGTGPRL